VIMLTFVAIGLYLSFSGGWMIDKMHDTFTGQHIYDVPPRWDASPQVFSIINIFYLVCYGLPVVGIGVFIFTLIPWQQYDEYNQFGGYR
jgi:hypothetical protein